MFFLAAELGQVWINMLSCLVLEASRHAGWCFHLGATGKSTSKVSVYLLTFGGSLVKNKIKSQDVSKLTCKLSD